MNDGLGRALSEPGRTRIQVPGSADAPEADLITGFQNGFVFELVDTREEQPLAVHVLVLNPTRYELTEPHQSTLTPTAGNTVVDESTGIIQGQVILEGTFGVRERRANAFEGAQGGGAPLKGAVHFRGLRDLFRRYSAAKQDPASAAYTKLVLHVLRDDDHFILAQPVFTTPRDSKSNRMHYLYRIQAAYIGDATEISRLRRRNVQNGTDFFDDATRAITKAFNDARAAFAEVNQDISHIRRKLANINTVMVNAAQFINAVGNTIGNGADTFFKYPFKLAVSVTTQVADAADFLAETAADSTAGIIGNGARSLRQMEDAFNRIAAFPEKFEGTTEEILRPYFGEKLLTAQDVEDRAAGATIGSRVRVRAGSESDAAFPGDYSSVQTVKLTATDTLESLSSRFSVDPELIVIVNDLRPPYIHPGGGPGILTPGDNILIPTRERVSGGASGGGGTSDYLSVEDALYGVDLAIDMDKLEREGLLDLRDPVRGDAGDADLARGLNNVIQGTAITIWTERGSMQYLPDVGISRNVGRKGTVQHVMLAALNLREAILADSRISGIAESEVILDGDVLTQEITPIVTGQRNRTKIVLPFGKATGGS